MQWEYTEVTEATINLSAWMLQLNAMGSLGWEVVGIASVDPTLGLNSYTAVLKRNVLEWRPGEAGVAAWLPDPTERFTRRYWDGLRWTQHVTDAVGVTDTDWPNRRST